MNVLGRITALAMLLLAGLACLQTVPALAQTIEAEAATERRVMVMLKLGADHYRAGGDYGGPYGDSMGEKARLRLARKIARANGLTVLESWPMQLIGVDCIIMQVNDDRAPADVAAHLSTLKDVAWSQPLNEYHLQSAPAGAMKPQYNDRLFAAQPTAAGWSVANLHRVATGKGVTIAIVDSQIEIGHPDLAGRIALSPDFVGAGQNLAERHGTGVAGIIAARPNNSVGIAGVAPGARVLGLRACRERPHGGQTVCDTLSLAKALTFALENRADVINLSLTGPRDRLLQTLVSLGVQRGITIVAAVDSRQPRASFPAFVAGVIPVTDGHLPAGAPDVYIGPGRDILTTEPEGTWSIVSGSSFAAAHVSGLAALLHELAGPGNRHPPVTTWLGPRGMVNACASLKLSRPDATCGTKH